ncbi:DUF300-domain-containing protein [Russula emetica]|nr:DUF300-domain-containing protein [Russula emetica]
MYCPSDNAQAVDQSHFWSFSPHWDAHRIGWLIAGLCALVANIISAITVLHHCRNYTKPAEQRQIIRVLYMPPVYAIISFFSYRFFRSYTYYSLIEIVYEAITISAFLLLLIEYVASTSVGHSTEGALARKGKRPLPAPFCCWRFRPTKTYFMYTLKWSVMQYVVVRPVLTIVAIICQRFNVLCESSSYNVHFASLYLDTIDFISVSIALYGLILFYDLTKEELAGRRPLAKFLSIKLIVFFTYYQSFMFTVLEDHVIHGTKFWTRDFAVEIGSALTYFASRIRGRRHQPAPNKRSLGQAFGVEGYVPVEGELRSNEYATSYTSRSSYDEDIRLTPYKASPLDLSRVHSPEDVDAYRPEESTLAA